MTTTLILIIVNTLIIMGLNSSLSLMTNQYQNNIILNNTETIINQEKILSSAVDSFCRVNIDNCFNELKTNNIKNFSEIEIGAFIPNNVKLEKMNDEFFQNIAIDYINKTVIITHNVNDINNREKYFGNRLNKHKDISCFNNETAPCASTMIYKKEKISEELNIKLNEKEISLLNAKLLQPELYVGEHQEYRDKIDLYQNEIMSLTEEKQKRKLTNFKGE